MQKWSRNHLRFFSWNCKMPSENQPWISENPYSSTECVFHSLIHSEISHSYTGLFDKWSTLICNWYRWKQAWNPYMGEKGIVKNMKCKIWIEIFMNYADQDILWTNFWLGIQFHYSFDTTECPCYRLDFFSDKWWSWSTMDGNSIIPLARARSSWRPRHSICCTREELSWDKGLGAIAYQERHDRKDCA